MGERLFGPGASFGENCGGVELLAPGGQMTCTFEQAPLLRPATWRTDYLDLDAPGIRGIYFECE